MESPVSEMRVLARLRTFLAAYGAWQHVFPVGFPQELIEAPRLKANKRHFWE